MKFIKPLLLVLAVPFYLIIQAPLGFYDGYKAKNGIVCQSLSDGNMSMRNAATGVMMEGGMGSGGNIMFVFETELHKEWRHKGMLYSFKACFDEANRGNKANS